MPDIYEIVNATQLDNDLEDIADAIRAKSQGQDPLQFPNEFISEIGSIPTGASITGQTDVTVKAMETIAQGDTVLVFKKGDKTLYDCFATRAYSCAFSPNGTRLAFASEYSPYVLVYDTTTMPYTKLPSPATLPAGAATGVSWSPDGNYLAVSHDTSPFITIYDTTTTPYTKIANPGTLPGGKGNGCAFSPDGTMLAVAHASGDYITVYNTSTWSKRTTPSNKPGGTGQGCAWSPDSSRLAVAHVNSPRITIYGISGATMSKYTNPSDLPTGNAYGCAYNHAGTRLAVCHATSPFITIYDTSTTPYTKIADPGTLPGTTCWSCTWNADDTKLFVGRNYSNSGLAIYDTSSTPYQIESPTWISNYGVGRCFALNPTGTRLAGAGNYAPFEYVYSMEDVPIMWKASNSSSGPILCSYGYAKSSILSGYTGTAAVLFEP